MSFKAVCDTCNKRVHYPSPHKNALEMALADGWIIKEDLKLCPKCQREKLTKPDVVIQLTESQIEKIKFLIDKKIEMKSGMLFGSAGNSGKTIALRFIPQELAKQISDLAYEQLGENDVNS